MNFAGRVEGRYVTLTLLGSERVLALCEVEVCGYHAPTGENLNYYMSKCARYAAILPNSGIQSFKLILKQFNNRYMKCNKV